MTFSRFCICSSVTLKDVLYLLNYKTCLGSKLYCTGQQVDTKVINTSVVLWRRRNKKERPVPIFSTIISSHLSLEISVVYRSRVYFNVAKWGSLKVGRTLKSFGILATNSIHLWEFRASARHYCGAGVATRVLSLLWENSTAGSDSMVVLDHCIRRIAGHRRLKLWALQLQPSNHIFSIRLSERHKRRMGIIISMLWSWVANINAYFTCNHFWQIPLFLVAYRSFILLLFHKAGDPSSLLLALLSALQVLIPYLSKLSSELNHWCYWYANSLQLGWGFLKSTPKFQSYRLQWAEWLVDPC